MPDPNPEKKKVYDKAMKEDPDWKAFVSKKRAAEKAASKSREQP
jgi:hypothetical protein